MASRPPERGERADRERHQLLDARPARGRQRAEAARARELGEAPRDGGRVRDARFGELAGEALRVGGRLRIVEPRGEARRARMLGRRLEERVERFLHRRAVVGELRGERVPVRAVHGLGDDRALLGRARQRLRLLVVVVLQPVLEAAQEGVGVAEGLHARWLHQPPLADGRERGARRCRAQARVAPAAHQLEELHRELDLADAAAADLDVVGLAAPDRRLEDARVQLAQLLEQAVVEVAAVHEGVDALAQPRLGPGDHARLEPRVSLPRARMGDEIVLELGE